MIPIAQLEKFDRKKIISRVEVRNMIGDFSKPIKLRNVYTEKLRVTLWPCKTGLKVRQ